MIINEKAKMTKKLFLKDPNSTDLGKRIINSSIKIIDTIGFEAFNFKKLAIDINSTEASIYRYFENKYKLLFYLISWYWTWVKSSLDYQLKFIKSPREKIKIIIRVIFTSAFDDPATEMIDEAALARIVITESTKTYTKKQVTTDYEDGLFEAYKQVCKKIASVILEANPNYKNPKALSMTIIMGVHKQIFFSNNLPELTDVIFSEDNMSSLEEFMQNLVFSTLGI